MATVSLRCINCGQHYMLGNNARVVSGLGLLDKIKSNDILGSGGIGFMSNSDLIDLCVCGALSPEEKRKQEKIIGMIKKGQRSQCKKCNATQNY